MRAIATLTAAAALLALAACERLGIGGSGGSAGNGAEAPANIPAAASGTGKDPGRNQAAAEPGGKDPAAGAVQAYADGGLDRDYVVGRWTDNDDCGSAVEFSPDGRFIATDGVEGLWTLRGDRLTVTGSRTLTMRIAWIDPDTMAVVEPDGAPGARSTRC